jgi:hypothetical protein
MAIKTEVVAIKVSPEEKNKIKKIAEEQDITVSKLLYRILRKEIFEDGSSKSTSSNN